jgi:branched-chain amino acid transport system substrate-binding protein
MLAPTSTNPKVTQVGNYIFRGCFIDSFQGLVMAKLALEQLKAKRVAILFSANTAYGADLANYFKEGIHAGGATIVAETQYREGDQDFKTQLATIKAAKPDVIFAPGYYAEGALIMKQARELGLTAPFLGGDGWEDEAFTKVGGNAVEGVRVCSHFSLHDPSPRVQAFVAAYRKRWGLDATVDASLGYDAAMMLADAIKRAGVVRHAAIRDALAATKNFEAVTGTINVNENRDVSKSVVILAVKDGTFQFVERIAP